jgi:hypothetical protein
MISSQPVFALSPLCYVLSEDAVNNNCIVFLFDSIDLGSTRGELANHYLTELQLDAARMVTGLPIFKNSEYLYAETGWETLSERRYRRKLQLFFNIKCGMAPEYLRHLIPPTIQSTTIYPLRYGDNLIVPFCRLSINNSSFIPSTVEEWNKLDIAIRKLDSLSKFKNAIRVNSQSNKILVPKFITMA